MLILFNIMPIVLLIFWFFLSSGLLNINNFINSITVIILLMFMFYIKLHLCIIDSVILVIYSLYLIIKYYNKKLTIIFIILVIDLFSFLIDLFVMDIYTIFMSV